MIELYPKLIEGYLERVYGHPVELLGVSGLGETGQSGCLKGYGYGQPLAIRFKVQGRSCRAVLHTIKPGPFGHEHRADRAGELLWCHGAFNRLPRHVRSLDVGGFGPGGELVSLGQVGEFFLLTEYVEGSEYAHDLARLRGGGRATRLDRDRADALCDYLVEIHQVRSDQGGLYARRVRELVGHHQCIMGLIDSYPSDHAWITGGLLKAIEQKVIGWRWRLKGKTHRLAQVHGDFHPWNILFEAGSTRFHLLDRSRGVWGDPADDVTSITLNYVFESLQGTRGWLEGDLAEMFHRFWGRYLEASGDRELLAVAGPYLAFRGLVMASPVWYPKIDEGVRRSMMALVSAVLDDEVFEPRRIDEYLQPS